MYFVLTTQNTTELAIDHQESRVKFQVFVTKQDFPLRVVARMVIVKEVIHFILINRDQMAGQNEPHLNLVDIAEKQWETAQDDWMAIYNNELSDPYIRLWLKSELMAQGAGQQDV